MMDQREIKEKVNKGWLRTNLVLQAIGRPAEYLEQALEIVIDNLSKSKDAVILHKKIHKSEKVPESKEVFMTFSEVEILVKDFSKLAGIVFDYMPASVEIVEPANISFKLDDANAIINDLAARLHQYDSLLKQMKMQIDILAKKFKEIEGKKK